MPLRHVCIIIGPDLLDLLIATSEDSKTQKLTDTEVLDEAITFGEFFLQGHYLGRRHSFRPSPRWTRDNINIDDMDTLQSSD